MSRKSWDIYFLELCYKIAERSTCDRAHHGCIITNKEHRILSTGYNGSFPGCTHCDEVGHYLINNHCKRTIHAERNAIFSATKLGISLNDSIAYVTGLPCPDCTQALICCGISKVICGVLANSNHPKDNKLSKKYMEWGKVEYHIIPLHNENNDVNSTQTI